VRCASIAIGIVAYDDRQLRVDHAELRYAVADARAFHRYVSLAWPAVETGSVHLELLDGQASKPSIEAAFTQLSAAGKFDLAIVYLGGHGQREPHGSGWFCAADAASGHRSLDGPSLDSLLALIQASSVLLLVDCCYAEATTADMAFFGRLAGSQSRLFCASARANELAWEDDELQRSVFSHVLFLALSESSPLADRTGHVDLEAGLLPFLRAQTPLIAAQQKRGAIQQPVIGGQSATATLLPTVQMRSIGRATTLRETLRNEARRIVAVIALTALFGLVGIEALFSHLAVSGDQRVLLRPGLSWTFSALPWHLAAEVDTGFRIAQLDATKESEIQDLSNGSFRTISTRRTDEGMRMWIEQLEPLVRSPKALAFIHAPGYRASGTTPSTEPEPSSKGFESINFAARIGGIEPIAYVAKSDLISNAPVVDVDCISLQENVVQRDFVVAGTGSIVEFVRAYVRYVAPQTEDPSAALWKLARFVSSRALLRNYDATAQSELDTLLLEAARNASRLPLSDTTRKAIQLELPPNAPTACSLTAIVLAAVVGSTPMQQLAEAQLASLANQNAQADLLIGLRKQGVGFAVLFARLSRYLVIIASHRPLDPPTLAVVASTLADEINPDLEGALEECPLTSEAYDKLLKQMQDSSDDAKQMVAFRSLGQAYRFLSPAARDVVFAWAGDALQKNRMVTDFIVTLGLIGRDRALSPPMLTVLLGRLSPEARFEPESPENFAGSVIETDADPAVVALAMAAPNVSLGANAVRTIEDIVSRRQTLAYRSDAMTGLAALWSRNEGVTDASILRRLRNQRGSAIGRALAVQMAVIALNKSPQRSAELAALAADWRGETEPEMRRDLGEIIAQTD
jgi:hypothetical protein